VEKEEKEQKRHGSGSKTHQEIQKEWGKFLKIKE
jgi:hypothetical protein